MTSAILWVIGALILLAIIVVVVGWFYERATNEVSLVRTGIGGGKVTLNGGTIAIPYFHEISRVSMQTLRLDVQRGGAAALITKDRMRVDIGAEFYVSVVPTEDDVTRAAQTLGKRTFQPDLLRELIDGMMVDALRSVAASMTMDELHENRTSFVTQVRETIAPVLARYGLQLDSVSLTAMDQTPFEALDENNAFNAVGMRKLVEVISDSKKERARIEGEADVEVRRAAMEASKRKLEIDLDERRAEISQQQDIEVLMAAQLAEVARQKAESERATAQARIQMEKDIQSADIDRETHIRGAEIERERFLQVAEQERQISTAAKSQEESKAQAAADDARQGAVRSAEAVTTARLVAEAERRREVAVVGAKLDADAAVERVVARKAEADAKLLETQAEAEGIKVKIEAENTRTAQSHAFEIEKAKLEALPKIVSEMVKPAEKINSINIHQISGGGTSSGTSGNKPVVNQALDSIMDMAVQMPALKSIGEAVGLDIEENLAAVSDTSTSKRKKKDKS